MPNVQLGIYKYGQDYKIIWYKTGIYNNEDNSDDNKEDSSEDCSENDEKLKNNIIRAKSKVKEYVLCNDWEYFVTLTLGEKKQNRYDLESYHRAFKDWIHGYNRKYNADLKYITIPELHEKGGWHQHGFFMGVAPESLTINEHGYLDMPYYQNRFGWISLDKIKDKRKAGNYITKYISKDISARVKEVGKHLYYCSKGLKQKEYIVSINGEMSEENLSKFYQNDYCGILWTDDISKLDLTLNRSIAYNKLTGDLI